MYVAPTAAGLGTVTIYPDAAVLEMLFLPTGP